MQSSITLINRNVLNIVGVTKVTEVGPKEILIELNGECLGITGVNLEVQALDVENKILNVTGTINSIKFQEAKIPLLKRIFK